MVTQLVQ